MFISFVDSSTVKEIKLQAEWHAKQSKKLMRIFRAEFSKQERHRAENCTAGKATALLTNYALEYFHSVDESNQTFEHMSVLRPSTQTLIFNTEFNTDKPYYNKYFASWWYKKNWINLVRAFTGEHNI